MNHYYFNTKLNKKIFMFIFCITWLVFDNRNSGVYIFLFGFGGKIKGKGEREDGREKEKREGIKGQEGREKGHKGRKKG